MFFQLRTQLAVCAVFAVAIIGGPSPRACAAEKKAPKPVIRIKGSDTMNLLANSWAEAYKKIRPDVDIRVSSGGSGIGIAALSKGGIDIADSSRHFKPSEIEETRKNTGKEPQEFTVAYDALAIYVHKNNPLSQITLSQVAGIYGKGGGITRWSDLGVRIPGASKDEVIRVGRQSTSGTHEFLREHVLQNKDFKMGSMDMSGSRQVVAQVSHTPTAIGYSGMGYATPGVKMLKVAATDSDKAYLPNAENTLNKAYPIARSLHMCTLGEPSGEIKKYIDWCLSDAGQKIVEESGYVPIPASDRRR